MNMKCFALAATGAFIFVFLYEFFVHGFLMMGLYEQTASVWRPQSGALSTAGTRLRTAVGDGGRVSFSGLCHTEAQ